MIGPSVAMQPSTAPSSLSLGSGLKPLAQQTDLSFTLLLEPPAPRSADAAAIPKTISEPAEPMPVMALDGSTKCSRGDHPSVVLDSEPGEEGGLRAQPIAFAAAALIDTREIAWTTLADGQSRSAVENGNLLPRAALSGPWRVSEAIVSPGLGTAAAPLPGYSPEVSVSAGPSNPMPAVKLSPPGEGFPRSIVSPTFLNASEPLFLSDKARGLTAQAEGAVAKFKAPPPPREKLLSAAVRVDIAPTAQGLAIGILMPQLPGSGAEQLSRRLSEVLAAYEGMKARVTVNGSELSFSSAIEGGYANGDQRN